MKHSLLVNCVFLSSYAHPPEISVFLGTDALYVPISHVALVRNFSFYYFPSYYVEHIFKIYIWRMKGKNPSS